MPAEQYKHLRREVATLEDKVAELEAELIQANEDKEDLFDINTDLEEESQGLRLEQAELECELELERTAREEAEAMCELLKEQFSEELMVLRGRVERLEKLVAEGLMGRRGHVRGERTIPGRMEQDASLSGGAAPASRERGGAETEA